MKFIILFFLSVVAYCQQLSFSLPEPSAYTGTTINLTVTFQDSTPSSNINNIQFNITLPPGITSGAPTCSADPTLVCLNSIPLASFASGVIATIPLIVSSIATVNQYSISIANPTAANISSVSVPITFLNSPSPITFPLNVAASTGITTWFTVQSGSTECRVSKVAQFPIKLNYFCASPYGSSVGYYTASSTSGLNYFTIGINSITNPSSSPVSGTNVLCTIQVNSTLQAQLLGFLNIAPNTAYYSCSSSNTVATNPNISWP